MRRSFAIIPITSPIYIGLDMSLTAAGYSAIAGDETVTSGVWKPPKGCDGVPRLIWFERTISDFISQWKPRLVAVEDYAYGMGQRAHQIGELGGIVRVVLARSGYPACTVPLSATKKFATGKGNAAKGAMMLAAFKKWGFSASDDNEADAYCVARYAQAVDRSKVDAKGVTRLYAEQFKIGGK